MYIYISTVKWDIYLGHDFFSENHVDEMVLTYIYISFNKAPFSAMSVEKNTIPPRNMVQWTLPISRGSKTSPM